MFWRDCFVFYIFPAVQKKLMYLPLPTQFDPSTKLSPHKSYCNCSVQMFLNLE